MEIIIEYVLLDNFLIDSLLLILTNKILKIPINKVGVILAGIFGAGFAVVSPLIKITGILAVLLKLLIGLIIVWISNLNLNKIFLRFALFTGLTFLFGGLLIALFNFLTINVYDTMYIGYVSSLPLGTIIISILVFTYILLKIIKDTIKTKFFNTNSCEITLFLNNKQAKIKGFIDSGNTLHNSKGNPVIVISENVLSKWFNTTERIKLILNENLETIKTEYITVSSMGGNYQLKTIDCIAKINGKTKQTSLGISHRKINCGDCEGIVGLELTEV